MAVPSVTATISSSHEVTYPHTDLSPTKTINLEGAATNTPILEWEWCLIPTDPNNPGGLPAGSSLLSGTHGDFTNGKSSVQNPSIPVDYIGGYNFSLRARNADGWSDPSFTGDGIGAQAIAYILTPLGVKRPPSNMFYYENGLNLSLEKLEDALTTGSLVHEEEFATVGTETPGQTVSFGPLNAIPVGGGAADTPSSYDLLVFRNGVKMRYSATPSTYSQYYYDSVNNEIDVLASGSADNYEVVYNSDS